jgi:hypothetical protein
MNLKNLHRLTLAFALLTLLMAGTPVYATPPPQEADPCELCSQGH